MGAGAAAGAGTGAVAGAGAGAGAGDGAGAQAASGAAVTTEAVDDAADADGEATVATFFRFQMRDPPRFRQMYS